VRRNLSNPTEQVVDSVAGRPVRRNRSGAAAGAARGISPGSLNLPYSARGGGRHACPGRCAAPAAAAASTSPGRSSRPAALAPAPARSSMRFTSWGYDGGVYDGRGRVGRRDTPVATGTSLSASAALGCVALFLLRSPPSVFAAALAVRAARSGDWAQAASSPSSRSPRRGLRGATSSRCSLARKAPAPGTAAVAPSRSRSAVSADYRQPRARLVQAPHDLGGGTIYHLAARNPAWRPGSRCSWGSWWRPSG
jgi:hypothetical protein